MFSYCVWYRVYSEKTINLIKIFSDKFKTHPFPPHLTVKHSLTEESSKMLFENTKRKDIPQFVAVGKPYRSQKDDFFSIQQDYIDKSMKNTKIFHISLAYRVGSSFTDQEMDFVKSFFIPTAIPVKDISVELWNCDSKYCSDWYIKIK